MSNKDLQERQDRRTLRWGKRQGILRQRRLNATTVRIVYEDGGKEEIDFTEHIAKGWVDEETLQLTPAGELKLHQLTIRKWLAEHPRKNHH